MVEEKNVKLLVIVGPTASGKTELSINLAKLLDGEIISADSRAIYKHMDVGTAKPTETDMRGIPHWGIDIAGHGEIYSVADYKRYAKKMIEQIQQRGKIPILVGGSGLYINAVVYDYNFASKINVDADKDLEELSINELHKIIEKRHLVMPENYKNKRYLINTIKRGRTNTKKRPLKKGTIIIGINPGKDILRSRVEERLQAMLNNSVVEEIKKCAKIYGWDSVQMNGGVYKSLKKYTLSEEELEKARENAIKSDMALIKKQLTWFKRDNNIRWFQNIDVAYKWVCDFMGVE